MKARFVNEALSDVLKPKSQEDVAKITKNLKSEEIYNLIWRALKDADLELADQYLKLKKLKVWHYVALLNFWEEQVKLATKDPKKFQDRDKAAGEYRPNAWYNRLAWKKIYDRYQANLDLLKKYKPSTLRSKIKNLF